MFHKKTVQKRLALVLGGMVGVVSVGLLVTFAVLNTNQEIPDTETGTIGYALSTIISGNWQTNSIVGKSLQLGGVDGYKYLRLTGSLPLGCTQNNEVLQSFNMDGTNVQCKQVSSTRPRPILATVRDLDSSCFGGGFKRTNPGYSSGGTTIPSSNDSFNNSNIIDLYENDTLTTNGSCSLASLYMPDNSIVRIGPNSSITLRYAGIPGGSGATSTDLDNGELWARVLKPVTDDSYFNVNTQEASVGVRGTSVYIKRNATTKEITAIPIDSGKLSPTDISNNAGAIVVYPSDRTIGSIDVPLMHRLLMQGNHPPTLQPYPSGTARLYADQKFVRQSTLADIRDFKEYGKNLGNLATLKTLSSEFAGYGGETTRMNPTAILSLDDGIRTSSTLTTEITRTLPTNADEKTNLCKDGGKKWWDFVPTGQHNCIESNTLFFADYTRGDTAIYGSGFSAGISNSGNGGSLAINQGFSINTSGHYIKYNTGATGINPSSVKGKTVKIKVDSEPDTSQARYVLDFGNIKVRRETTGGYLCLLPNRDTSGCNASFNPGTKEITIKLPTDIMPTQFLFGTLYDEDDYVGPIGVSIQSIRIQ